LVFINEHLKEGWARKMKKLLLEIKNAVEDAVRQRKSRLSIGFRGDIDAPISQFFVKGLLCQPPPVKRRLGQRGKPKQPPAKNLLYRLKINIDEVLAFMYDFTTPFTNNLAERDLRMVKVKPKVSGCFRTAKGASIFYRIRSFMSTLQKQNLNILEYTRNVFDHHYADRCLIPV
jgi:transposase